MEAADSEKEGYVMLSRLTHRSAVVEALKEFNEKGRERFLAESNFGASKRYFVRWSDRLYDAKAIAGRALEMQHSDLNDLPHDAFHGGPPVQRRLEELGFEVVLTSPASRDGASTADATAGETKKHSRVKIGRRIRHIRGLLGMTQKELGERIGVLQATVSSWETARSEPKEHHLRGIAELVMPSDRAFRWMNLERTTQPSLRPKGSGKSRDASGNEELPESAGSVAAATTTPPRPPGGHADWPQQAGIFDDPESVAAAREELLNWMVEIVDTQPNAASYATSLVNMFNAAVERLEKLGGP